MDFQHPDSDYIEKSASFFSWLWVLLFGPLYWVIRGGVAARGGASDSGDFNSRDCPFPLSVLYLFDFAKTLSETGIETAGLNCKSMQSRHLWQMPTSLFGPLFFGLSFVGNSLLP